MKRRPMSQFRLAFGFDVDKFFFSSVTRKTSLRYTCDTVGRIMRIGDIRADFMVKY